MQKKMSLTEVLLGHSFLMPSDKMTKIKFTNKAKNTNNTSQNESCIIILLFKRIYSLGT